MSDTPAADQPNTPSNGARMLSTIAALRSRVKELEGERLNPGRDYHCCEDARAASQRAERYREALAWIVDNPHHADSPTVARAALSETT